MVPKKTGRSPLYQSSPVCISFSTGSAVEVGLKTQLTLLSADRDRLRSLTLFPWVRNGLLYV